MVMFFILHSLRMTRATRSQIQDLLQFSPGMAASGVDCVRTSTIPIKSRSDQTGLVESSGHVGIRLEHDHLTYLEHILLIDAVSDLFRFQQAVGDQTDALLCESHDIHSTINTEDAESVLREIGSDDRMYSTPLMEDIHDINDNQPLTLEDKEFLVALDWEKDLS
ncbi:hypothetical protein MHU86_1230 [Fragilaria crotonensis]|nr:hypothetical protein MHU86_1230 [Fragilaria crotonensis]